MFYSEKGHFKHVALYSEKNAAMYSLNARYVCLLSNDIKTDTILSYIKHVCLKWCRQLMLFDLAFIYIYLYIYIYVYVYVSIRTLIKADACTLWFCWYRFLSLRIYSNTLILRLFENKIALNFRKDMTICCWGFSMYILCLGCVCGNYTFNQIKRLKLTYGYIS